MASYSTDSTMPIVVKMAIVEQAISIYLITCSTMLAGLHSGFDFCAHGHKAQHRSCYCDHCQGRIAGGLKTAIVIGSGLHGRVDITGDNIATHQISAIVDN